MQTTSRKYSYLVTAIILAWLTFLAATRSWLPVLDDMNLVFHEAGHAIFGFSPDVVAVLAGSLFQILLPFAIAFAFIRQRDWLGVLIMTWWGGENMIGVGRYIADARAQNLDLLGGEHDWANLLGRVSDLLPYDTAIGGGVRNFGIVVMIVSISLLILLFAHKIKESLRSGER